MRRPRWRNEPRVGARRLRPRAVRAGTWGIALLLGVATGALRGEALLARALPERATRLRLAVVGNAKATPRELAAAAGIAPRARLATLDLARVQAGITAHPWVARARVTTFPPDLVLVAVEEREPVAMAPIGAKTWLVDRSGSAFLPAGPGTELPALVGAGARDDALLAEGVAWLDALAAHGIAAPHGLVLADADPARAPALELASDAPAPGAKVLLGSGEREAKLDRLARLLAAGLPELRTAAEIDLRFGADVILRPRPEAEGAAPDGAATDVTWSSKKSEGAG